MADNRRDQIRLTPAEIDAFLSSQKTLILTSNGKNGFPHPMPMWFTRDGDGTIRMTTYRKSQKVRNIERDPCVTLLVESGEEYQDLKAVVFQARAELIDDYELVVATLVDIAAADLHRKGIAGVDRNALGISVAGNARKRVVVSCRPVHTISWDHRKLAGAY